MHHLSYDTPLSPAAAITRTDHTAPPTDSRQALRTALGDRRDLQTLARRLNEASQSLADNADASAVLAFLRDTPIDVDPDSSFRQLNNLEPNGPVSLASFIAGKGTYMPTSRAELIDMARALADRALEHPLGNFGGALSWSVPPSVEQQRAIDTLVSDNTPTLPGYSRLGRPGALDYLLNVHRLSAAELRDPEKALETLLGTPQAQVLGNAIQTRLGGFASDTHVSDYVLTAIHVGLDPESINAPHRNKVANFDLASDRHWGKSAGDVINALSRHLERDARTAEGRGSLAARVLLAKAAPQFLVKDIPPQVVYGSQAWANFCIAVAAQEVDAPGTVRNKTYAQVMSDADSSNVAPSEAAVLHALIDWAVCNGHLPKRNDDRYDSEEIARARSAFNDQQSAVKTASAGLGDAVPSRKAMALAKLKEKFPDLAENVFEKRVLSIKDREFNPGARSMLDIIMEGHTLADGEEWETFNKDIPINRFNAFSQSPDSNITDDFNSALAAQKQLHHTLVKNLVTDLPLEDRENLAYGKLEFFKEGTYRIGTGFIGGPQLKSKKNRLLIKVERNQETHIYALDPEKGTLSKKTTLSDRASPSSADILYKTDLFTPDDKTTWHLQDLRVNGGPPNSFSSDRTQHIANVYLEALGLEQQARGVTSYDKERGQQEAVTEFLLDFIPLRSAIVNFRDGNYGTGALDLTLDVFGFITAGLGAGAKAVKNLKNAGSAVSKLLKTGKILGAATLGELNPLSGTGELLVGAGKLLTESVSTAVQGIKKLRGTAGSADLLEASKHYESAATGTFKVGEHTVEGSAVLQKGKWYAFDANKMQPYGTPIDDFSPSHTLMPGPNTHAPRHHRTQPYNQNGSRHRPIVIRKDLPVDTYSEAMKGKLEWGHFIRGKGKDETLKKFSDELRDFYDGVKLNPIPRPTIPNIQGPVEVPDLITDALKASNGIVFGESHKQMASFRMLQKNIDTFVSQNVKKVYFEGVIDFPPHGLIDDGIGMLGDTGHLRTNPTFQELKALFESKGIEVLPLDHYYLTRHKDLNKAFRPTATDHGSLQRLEEFNYHGSEVIQANSGTEKWIALVGWSHMKTSEGVPGLAELTGGIGIGVFDKTNIAKSVGLKDTTHIPDPTKALKPDDLPGDLQIYIKP